MVFIKKYFFAILILIAIVIGFMAIINNLIEVYADLDRYITNNASVLEWFKLFTNTILLVAYIFLYRMALNSAKGDMIYILDKFGINDVETLVKTLEKHTGKKAEEVLNETK